jgi:glucose 1-dehydrogenase
LEIQPKPFDRWNKPASNVLFSIPVIRNITRDIDTMLLKGQTALITGGSSGIGRAIAMAIAAAGATVAVNHRAGAERAAKLVDDILGAGGSAFAVEADVSDEAAVERMFKEVITRCGRLDILVANAGLQKDASFQDMSLADWRRSSTSI